MGFRLTYGKINRRITWELCHMTYHFSLSECLDLIRADPNGNLDLSRFTDPFTLPEGLDVPGNLLLAGRMVASLPRIRVGGLCDITASSVHSIQAESYFGRGLIATDSELRHIPSNTVINGDLVAAGVYLYSFGINITIAGNAVFTDAVLPAFPESMVFGNSLDCSGSRFTVESPFQEGLEIPGDLHLDCARIQSLPNELKCECLFARYIDRPLTLGRGIMIRRDAFFDDSHIEEIPGDIYFGGSLSLANSRVGAMEPGIRICGDLDLSQCSLQNIPEGTSIWGDVYLEESSVRTIGERTWIRGSLKMGKDQVVVLAPGVQILGQSDGGVFQK